MRARLIFLCAALDDREKSARRITTDSPAGSRKVFMMLRALRDAGVPTLALSIARGRADGAWSFHPTRARAAGGVPSVFLAFTHVRFASELLTLVAPLGLLWRRRRDARRTTLLLYNREPAYLLAALAGWALGYRMMLDFEDAEVIRGGLIRRMLARLYDRICADGALLANTRLETWTSIRPIMPFYGIVEPAATGKNWNATPITMLFGGSLDTDRGSRLLAESVSRLRAQAPAWASEMELVVTGRGDGLPALRKLAAEPGHPRVHVREDLDSAAYAGVLADAQVGLSLRLHAGVLADTTFPSKVSELAGAGLLVVTTDVSDVRVVLRDGARYVERDDPDALIAQLRVVVEDRAAARATAAAGLRNIGLACAPANIVPRLAAFLVNDP